MSEAIQINISANTGGAVEGIHLVTDQTQQLQQALTYAGAAGAQAGTEIAAGMEKANFSMREAKGSAALLGEEIGVHINRHVAGFIATLPGVGEAMSAAFSAVAIIAIIELIAKATEKLTEFISAKLIYTEAMKKEYDANVALNQTYVEQAKTITDIQDKMKYFGLSDIQTLDAKIADVNTQLAKMNDTANDIIHNKIWLKENYDEGTESVAQMRQEYANTINTVKVLQAELSQLQAERGEKGLAQGNKNQGAKLAAQKSEADAEAAQSAELAKLMYDQKQISLEQEVTAEKTAAKQKLDAAEAEVDGKLAIAKQDPDRNSSEIITLNGQKLTLQTTFDTEMLRIDADYFQKKEELQRQADEALKKSFEEQKQAAEEAKKLAEATAEAGEAQLKYNAAIAQGAAEKQKDVVAQDVATKNYKQAIADTQTLITLMKAEEAADLAVVDAKIAAAQAAMNSADKQSLDWQKALKDYRDYQAERVMVATKAEQQIAEVSRKSTSDQDKDLKSLDNAMKPILSNLNQWIMSGGNLGVAMTRTFVEMGIKMLENLAIAELVGDKQKLKGAETAASNTWAQASAIPIIGPFIAPPLAAAAFAGVMAFDTGGMSAGGPALLHPREAVLNETQTRNFQQMTEGGGGGGHTFNFNNTFNGSNGEVHADMLMKTMNKKLGMLGIKL